MDQNDFQNQESHQNKNIETKFNFFAFISPILFAIGHKAWPGLLQLFFIIPIIGWIFSFIWMFVSGFKAEEWALKNGKFRDNQEFRAAMQPSNRMGISILIMIFAIPAIVLIFGLIFFGPFISDFFW